MSPANLSPANLSPANLSPLKPLAVRNLDAYRVALQLVSALRPLHRRIGSVDKALAGQLSRAAPSMPQNLAEGMRRTGRDRAHLLTIALGSTEEVRTIVDVAVAWGVLTVDEAAPLDALADRFFCAMTYRLRQKSV
jgi:four helix bundle protein